MDSLAFLDRVERLTRLSVKPVYVVHGDEFFLKRRVLAALRKLVLGPEPEAFGVSSYAGDKVSFATVHNELSTVPFLCPRRLVVIDNADPFITNERKKLEKYVNEPSATGVLVLDVKSWTSTTNLAKTLKDAVITCKTLPAARLPEWCQNWCMDQYAKPIAAGASRLLVDLVGPDMGLLDQELNKLSLYVGEAGEIDNGAVDRLVGNSREETTWKVFDLIGSGQTGPALGLLDRLFSQGEDVMKLLGAFSFNLRKVAQAARLVQDGTALNAALDEVGVPNFPAAREGAQRQMRHLGRQRLTQLYDWLVQTDLGLKGSSALPPRTLLERLVVQLARPVHQAAAGSR